MVRRIAVWDGYRIASYVPSNDTILFHSVLNRPKYESMKVKTLEHENEHAAIQWVYPKGWRRAVAHAQLDFDDVTTRTFEELQEFKAIRKDIQEKSQGSEFSELEDFIYGLLCSPLGLISSLRYNFFRLQRAIQKWK